MDPVSGLAATGHVYNEGGEVYDCMLNQLDLSQNTDKYVRAYARWSLCISSNKLHICISVALTLPPLQTYNTSTYPPARSHTLRYYIIQVIENEPSPGNTEYYCFTHWVCPPPPPPFLDYHAMNSKIRTTSVLQLPLHHRFVLYITKCLFHRTGLDVLGSYGTRRSIKS